MPHYELGIYYLMCGRIDDAKTKFSSACENKWDHIESHLELGIIEHNQGNNEQAIMHFKIVLDLNNSHKIAKNYLVKMMH
jgi:tetratricopeptide (TPR) repeat protein